MKNSQYYKRFEVTICSCRGITKKYELHIDICRFIYLFIYLFTTLFNVGQTIFTRPIKTNLKVHSQV